MKRILLCLALMSSGACGKKQQQQAQAQPEPVATPTPPDAGRLQPRAGGPAVADCEKAADRLAELVVATSVPPGAAAPQRDYVNTLLKQERRAVVHWCLETAVPREVECVAGAKDFPTLAACEHFRRDIPAELLVSKEVTQADCERFYDRLRQFKIGEGVDPKELDKTKDQIVRACQEKAKPGTIACFLASKTYAQARQCP